MNKERKNLLVFGYGLALILTFFAVRLWLKYGCSPLKVALLVSAATILAVTLINVQWLKPVYTRWMIVGQHIGHVVSLIILSVIFYTLFGVTGMILRLLGKDILNQKIQKEAITYWIRHAPVGTDPAQYTRQS
jgi:hypothetical protein